MDYQGIYQQIWSLWKAKRMLEAKQLQELMALFNQTEEKKLLADA